MRIMAKFTNVIWELSCQILLIHEADSQSRPVVIIIFACVVCTSVLPSFRPSFKISQNKTKFKAIIGITIGVNVGLAGWIIDGIPVRIVSREKQANYQV